MESTEFTCWHCGDTFIPTGRGGVPQRYCSARCRAKRREVADKRARAVRREDRPNVCPECGFAFTPPTHGAPKKFCSEKCKARANNRRARRSQRPLRNPTEKVCPQCGETFIAKNRNRVYCYGKFCAQAAYRDRKSSGEELRQVDHAVSCDECGAKFIARHPCARWCSTRCANRHWGRMRARQRVTPSALAYADRDIFERDGWRCHLCGKRISKTKRWPDPKSATIDHLVPLSLGGQDEPANVAAAHWDCNREKRAQALGEQLRLS